MTDSNIKNVDLLVVGAGIYGAWMAYDASLRGLKVLLIDKGDIANATSSASSKLIHGGLRYLEQFNFSLVKKSVKERQNLFKIAPHRVSPLKFGIPVYKGSRISAWKYKLGLTLYDWFANIKDKSFKHSSFSSESFCEEFPLLKKDKLKKGFTYLDAGTDDFRYTLEIVDGAVKNGAKLKTYCELISYENQQALIKEVHSNIETKVNFKAAINTTGQWTDQLFDTKLSRLSKGIHIILPFCNLDKALLLLSPIDQRVFFAIPWYGKTMVGTTDTDYSGNIDSVEATQDDIDYLLDSFNFYLNTPFSGSEVINSFAGLRVLKNANGHPSSVSRDWEWIEHKKNIYISLGGKFTSSREDCSKLIDHICTNLNNNSDCQTQDQLFPWAPADDFETWKHKLETKAKKLDLPKEVYTPLISRHGKRSSIILDSIQADNSLAQPLFKGLPFTKAEMQFILENEYVTTFEDLIRRRMPIMLLKKTTTQELEALKESANQHLKSLHKQELKT